MKSDLFSLFTKALSVVSNGIQRDAVGVINLKNEVAQVSLMFNLKFMATTVCIYFYQKEN